jgi:hypothetical protein
LTKAPVRSAIARASAPNPTGKVRPCLANEVGGGSFVVDRQGDKLDASVGQGSAGALEGA